MATVPKRQKDSENLNDYSPAVFSATGAMAVFSGPAAAWLRVASDLIMSAAAVLAALAWGSLAGIELSAGPVLIAYPPLAAGLLYFASLRRRRVHRDLLDQVASLVGATATAGMIVVAVALLASAGSDPGPLIASTWFLGTLTVWVGRAGLGFAARRSGIRLAERSVIVGSAALASSLARELQETPAIGLEPAAVIDADLREPGPPGLARYLAKLAFRSSADHVILVLSAPPGPELADVVHDLDHAGLHVSVALRPAEERRAPSRTFTGGLSRMLDACDELGLEASFLRAPAGEAPEDGELADRSGLPLVSLRAKASG